MEEGFRFKSSYWLLALPAIAFSGGGLLVAGYWLLVKRVKVQGSWFIVHGYSYKVPRFLPLRLHALTPLCLNPLPSSVIYRPSAARPELQDYHFRRSGHINLKFCF